MHADSSVCGLSPSHLNPLVWPTLCVQRTAIFDTPSLYEKLDAETLFFIFYNQPGSYQQYLVSGRQAGRGSVQACPAQGGLMGACLSSAAQAQHGTWQCRLLGGGCTASHCSCMNLCTLKPFAGGAGAEAAGLALPQAALGLVPAARGAQGGGPARRRLGAGHVSCVRCCAVLHLHLHLLLQLCCPAPAAGDCYKLPTNCGLLAPLPPSRSYVYFDSTLADEAGSGWCYRLKQNFLVGGGGGARASTGQWVG